MLGLTGLVALPLLIAPGMVGGWFATETGVLNAVRILLPIAAAIVLADDARAVLAGSLRGQGDVAVPAAMQILSFWLIAQPLGFWLAVGLAWSINGCAIALASGLIAAAVLFHVRMLQLHGRGAMALGSAR